LEQERKRKDEELAKQLQKEFEKEEEKQRPGPQEVDEASRKLIA
jgi:hypothetical protein